MPGAELAEPDVIARDFSFLSYFFMRLLKFARILSSKSLDLIFASSSGEIFLRGEFTAV